MYRVERKIGPWLSWMNFKVKVLFLFLYFILLITKVKGIFQGIMDHKLIVLLKRCFAII